MPWFKVDDSFESHPKVKSIPRPRRTRSIGLWTLAGCWCARQLTDGFLPTYMLHELGGTKVEADALVAAGLWTAKPDGYQFKDWEDWQPTRAKVEEEREAAKERMRAARERRKGESSGEVRANTSEHTQHRSVTPTRPDPTRPDPKENVDPDGSTRRGSALVALDRPDVVRICDHLASRIEANGAKRPTTTKAWQDAARLMLDRDGHTEQEIHGAIDWCQNDEFWRANILSLPKLREKYDQLKLQAQRKGKTSRQQETNDLFDRAAVRMGVISGGNQ